MCLINDRRRSGSVQKKIKKINAHSITFGIGMPLPFCGLASAGREAAETLVKPNGIRPDRLWDFLGGDKFASV